MENQKIEDINIALKLLKDGEILVSKNKTLTFFAQKKDKIHCQNSSASFNLSYIEFLSLYQGSTFFIYTFDNKTSIDIKKDEEYYSWNILKK